MSRGNQAIPLAVSALAGNFDLVQLDAGRLASLSIQKIVATHELDPEGLLEARFAAVVLVLGVVVKVLGGQAVGSEPGPLVGREESLRAASPLGVKPDGPVVELMKSLGERIVFHRPRS